LLVRNLQNRLQVLALLVVLVFLVLVGRVGYMQIVQGKMYTQLADGNRLRLIPVMAPRGTFFDRNGIPMVSNRPGFTVSLLPATGPVNDGVISQLALILGMNEAEIRQKISQQTSSFDPVRIKADIGPDIVTRIEERRSELPGVVIEIQPIRNYVYNELAAHVFGYVSEINDDELSRKKAAGYKQRDIIGKTGLESVYDSEMRGVDGGGQVEVDVTGRSVQVLGRKEPVPGSNLVLTIDYRIQKATETALDEQLKYLQTESRFKRAQAAAAVVINPQTGEILAMASRPTFNPNLFSTGISSKDWKVLNDNPNHPMDNKAISGEYSPGSTFKIVSGAAALEMGKVTPEERIFDSGQHWLIPKGNAEGEALGWINFKEALAKSDNVYFYEMGNRLGIDNLEKYARMFGLGQYTGINLPGESDGLVANRRYKQKVYGEDWYLSETFDAAIGQGFQLATPLQMAVLISEIANGGHRYRPYLVNRILSPSGEIIKKFVPEEVGNITLSPGNLQLIREALREVAQEGGTAGDVFTNFPIHIAGKTGTTENFHGDDHGWFVAYGPYEDPRVAVVVIVEQGGFGSSSAAPIARKIMEAAFNLNQSTQSDAPRVYKPHTVL